VESLQFPGLNFFQESLMPLDHQAAKNEQHGPGYEMDTYRSLLGHEGKGVERLVQSAEEIYQFFFGEKIKPEAPDWASI
jgi:hypothetical protein